jgi:hypothetical protein
MKASRDPVVADASARREAVRLGVRDALTGEVDRTSARTAIQIGVAGALGLASAVAAVGLFARGAMNVDPFHLAVCAAAWSSLLVIAFALAVLRIGSRKLPLAESASLALVGLGLAAVLGFACPDPQLLMWWMDTPLGHAAAGIFGTDVSTLCMGLCLALIAGAGASVAFAMSSAANPGVLLPGLLLFVLIWPAVAVQSLGESSATLVSWSAGLAAGSLAGVATGALLRRAIRSLLPAPR